MLAEPATNRSFSYKDDEFHFKSTSNVIQDQCKLLIAHDSKLFSLYFRTLYNLKALML